MQAYSAQVSSKKTTQTLFLLGILLALTGLGGCAVGQKFNYAQVPLAVKIDPTTQTMTLAVLDQREYILSAKKTEKFVGISRGGYGNPFDVTTTTGAPLATDMSEAISRALLASSINVQQLSVRPSQHISGARQALIDTGRNRLLMFTVQEWKTDTMMRTSLIFDVSLDVFDGKGVTLAQAHISGKEVASDSILGAAADAQRWFNEKFTELLSDSAVRHALMP
jgi:hypothetical protein